MWLLWNVYCIQLMKLLVFIVQKKTSMEYMFSNANIKSIDMKYLDVGRVKNFTYYIFLKWLNENIRKNEFVIYLSLFDISQAIICSGMFADINELVIIIISNTFQWCIVQISLSNKVINIDEFEFEKTIIVKNMLAHFRMW